jgi:hypothetical protein
VLPKRCASQNCRTDIPLPPWSAIRSRQNALRGVAFFSTMALRVMPPQCGFPIKYGRVVHRTLTLHATSLPRLGARVIIGHEAARGVRCVTAGGAVIRPRPTLDRCRLRRPRNTGTDKQGVRLCPMCSAALQNCIKSGPRSILFSGKLEPNTKFPRGERRDP